MPPPLQGSFGDIPSVNPCVNSRWTGRGIRGSQEEGAGVDARGAEPEASTTSRSGSGGGTESAPSPCSSWTVRGGGDVALGGSFLREPPPPGDAADGVGTPVALLFLKTRAPPESSLSEFITSTLFPLSGRAGAGVDAMANGRLAGSGGRWRSL